MLLFTTGAIYMIDGQGNKYITLAIKYLKLYYNILKPNYMST